ncbi:bifunctional [glutamine synthetase] adenylyltransferase/[glutamine synthetase]-adenylyl-L-tyrosine phosphorylase [Pseudochelatococcus sp. G4_1912]|uniref:bifunctional [glutamine synthetase] adenylyltransferase/[glutamine synthetase]-adenylyl-L-tyrosine phosphorylase n=1 Tax=Pseudochelatococcus sp. G4_1912 TaxID=3114288 RepID=UPI0039C73EB5
MTHPAAHASASPLIERIIRAPVLARPADAQLALAEIPDAGQWPVIVQTLIASLAEHSPFLWRLALGNPQRLSGLLAASPEEVRSRILADVANARREADTDALMRQLRQARAEHALLVALADLGGVWDLEAVIYSLSAFADAAVGSAIRFLLKQAKDSGRFTPPDPDDIEAGSGLVTLALGKHGAGELNYSSDIDIVLFYDPDAPVSGRAEPPAFFVKLARDLVKLLQERTADGYVFRVDLRLRPDPGSTAPAVSLPTAFSYYETVGQNWERAAFIKARPIAGDFVLGEQFLQELRPFIWRKYFDFATIADIHAMKRQIHAVRGHNEIAVAGHDIKLGRGGIREIEFFVQTQQLVFGGRRPALRGRRTLDMLKALVEDGWITDKARDELTAAYIFLRTIEHRLQMVADEQTQRLPTETDALEGFARFCGFASLSEFAAELTRQARIVQEHYALLFEDGPELAAEAGNLVFTGTEDDPETLQTLQRLGFREPEKVTETVRGWHFGRRKAVTSARAREVLTEITPALLTALGRTAAPDTALAALDEAFGRIPAVVELLSILRSNDRLLALFADLLGSAPRLTDVVAQSPHVLDAVIDPAFFSASVDAQTVSERVRALVAHAGATEGAFEEFLDRARDAARQETFLTGARLISGIIPPERAGEAYAAVAESLVDVTLDKVREAFAVDHGLVPGSRMVVLGFGRLGAREMTASSDLDLVVLYDFDPEQGQSDGARPLDAVVYHARLTQRLVSALTVPTRRGRLYEVDMRLRPSGGQGPVASQFRGFPDYYANNAETWEHMALTRARVVAGDASLANDVTAAIRKVLRQKRDRGALATAVRDMRALIASEKGEADVWDMKLARGGLFDLEFLAQYLVLAHAADHPELTADVGTARVFDVAGELGLLTPETAETLRAGYRLLSDVFQWQRLTVEGAFDPDKVAAPVITRIAGAVGLPDGKVLALHLDETRAQVRAVFDALLGGNTGEKN